MRNRENVEGVIVEAIVFEKFSECVKNMNPQVEVVQWAITGSIKINSYLDIIE